MTGARRNRTSSARRIERERDRAAARRAREVSRQGGPLGYAFGVVCVFLFGGL